MRRIQFVWWFIVVGVSLTYWYSINAVDQTITLWALRKSLLYYTGIMATAMMSVGVILALRLTRMESLLGGLDQHYRLHKWIGISTAFFALAHWLIKLAPKWLVKQGWVAADSFKTPADVVGFFAETNPFTPVRSFAKDMGEWAIYALFILVLLALWKRFPYRAFFKTHRLMAVIYLALIFHSVVLFGEVGWFTPVGFFMMAMMALGCTGAVISLRGQIGRQHRHQGTITQITSHEHERVTQVQLKVDDTWPGHEEGQFAFVTFDPKEGAHPFSISSPWRQDGQVTFHIKALGDYTATLPTRIHVGQHALLEGPYGRFQFEPLESTHQQVWIAGGIGITPFLSRLKRLAQPETASPPSNPTQPALTRPITLYYCTRTHDSSFVKEVDQLCRHAGVTLHIIASGRDQPLTVQTLCRDLPNCTHAHYWFCGPTGLGDALRAGLMAMGLTRGRFHQELFEMR